MSKASITSSVIVTDIPIKPQQFPTGCTLSLFRCRGLDLGPMTLKLNHGHLDISKMYLRNEKEVAR